jgi:transcription antitermination factor NusG
MHIESCECAWFAVRTRVRHEALVDELLRQKGFEVFYPKCEVERVWSDRRKVLERALFPGYIFCKFNPEERLRLLCTVSVISVIGDGTRPIPIDPEEFTAIRQIVTSKVKSEPFVGEVSGREVLIEKGPLAGLRGIIVKAKNSCRLVVTVSLLNRSIAAEIDHDGVRLLPAHSETRVRLAG